MDVQSVVLAKRFLTHRGLCGKVITDKRTGKRGLVASSSVLDMSQRHSSAPGNGFRCRPAPPPPSQDMLTEARQLQTPKSSSIRSQPGTDSVQTAHWSLTQTIVSPQITVAAPLRK